MSEYYVYVHRRPDTGEAFYVGMGKADRAKNTVAGRSQAWLDVFWKYGRDVEFLAVGLTKEEALIQECLEISILLECGAPLVNSKNVVRRKNVRDKGCMYYGELSYWWRNVTVPLTYYSSPSTLARNYGSSVQELEDVLDGKSAITSDGWITHERMRK